MASKIFTGYNYLISKRADPLFAAAIGLGAAIIRIRREETCHRLGIPSDSMVYLVEHERHKFDDTPASRSRLSASSWSIGDSKEADYLRQDAMRNKQHLLNPQDSSSVAITPMLSRHPETGELVLEGSDTSEMDEEELSDEEMKRRDKDFKRRFREAQPRVDELVVMFGTRAWWLTSTTWINYWAKPWFWYRWSRGWESWQTSSKGPSEKDYK